MKPDFDQLAELFAQMKTGRIGVAHLQRLIENPDRYDESLGRFGRIYDTEVNYDVDLKRLIKGAKQDYLNDNITTENFGSGNKGIRRVGLELYEFDRTVTGPEGVEEIQSQGYQLEGVEELVTFITNNPVAQFRRPIAAWKKTWQRPDGGVCVPYAAWGGGGRHLDLARFEYGFRPDRRVLVSRKQ